MTLKEIEESIDILIQASGYKRLRWNVRPCSICGSPVGYIFVGGRVYFDPNCDCVDYEEPYSLMSSNM